MFDDQDINGLVFNLKSNGIGVFDSHECKNLVTGLRLIILVIRWLEID